MSGGIDQLLSLLINKTPANWSPNVYNIANTPRDAAVLSKVKGFTGPAQDLIIIGLKSC